MNTRSKSSRRILIISPVRNEADFIRQTIESITQQTLTPLEWVIVDDGSTDGTAEIARAAASQFPWINVVQKPDRGFRAVGPGVVEAFYYGLERARTDSYDYLCKLDGDLEIGPLYFEKLVERFERDPYLGAASGKPYLRLADGTLVAERKADEMVAGMINFYRRACFESMGGFVREVHWDGIAFHNARMCGYRTRSFDDEPLRFIHLRMMGSSGPGITEGRRRWGRGQYFMGTHPLYLFAIVVYRMFERPFVRGGLGILGGYLRAWREKMPQYDRPGFRKSLHAWQMERLKLGRRLEKIPEAN